jgi:hypothetical protein
MGLMERRVKRLLYLSDALCRVTVLFGDYLEARQSFLAAGGKSDDALLDQHYEMMQRLEPSAFSRVETYMGHFMALLYEIADKWTKWGFHDVKVAALLDNTRIAQLKRFRQTVFHVDDTIHREAVAFADDEHSLQWCVQLLAEIRRSLLEWHADLKEKMGEELDRVGFRE